MHHPETATSNFLSRVVINFTMFAIHVLDSRIVLSYYCVPRGGYNGAVDISFLIPSPPSLPISLLIFSTIICVHNIQHASTVRSSSSSLASRHAQRTHKHIAIALDVGGQMFSPTRPPMHGRPTKATIITACSGSRCWAWMSDGKAVVLTKCQKFHFRENYLTFSPNIAM